MKKKYFTVMAAAVTLLASCSYGGSNNDASEVDTETIIVSEEEANLDPIEEKEEAKEEIETPAEEAKEEPQAKGNNLDGAVNQIISQINQQYSTVKSLVDNGILNSSSMALRSIESMPDYTRQLNKIKGQLTPEQKARIDAAERKLNKIIDEWNDQSENFYDM